MLNKKNIVIDDPLKTFYEQENYTEEISELKKDKNKSFDVIKSIKRKKQDDYEEKTPGKDRASSFNRNCLFDSVSSYIDDWKGKPFELRLKSIL